MHTFDKQDWTSRTFSYSLIKRFFKVYVEREREHKSVHMSTCAGEGQTRGGGGKRES